MRNAATVAIHFVLAQSAIAGAWWLGCRFVAWAFFPIRHVPIARLALVSLVAVAWPLSVSRACRVGGYPTDDVEALAFMPWWIGTLAGTIVELRHEIRRIGQKRIVLLGLIVLALQLGLFAWGQVCRIGLVAWAALPSLSFVGIFALMLEARWPLALGLGLAVGMLTWSYLVGLILAWTFQSRQEESTSALGVTNKHSEQDEDKTHVWRRTPQHRR